MLRGWRGAWTRKGARAKEGEVSQPDLEEKKGFRDCGRSEDKKKSPLKNLLLRQLRGRPERWGQGFPVSHRPW